MVSVEKFVFVWFKNVQLVSWFSSKDFNSEIFIVFKGYLLWVCGLFLFIFIFVFILVFLLALFDGDGEKSILKFLFFCWGLARICSDIFFRFNLKDESVTIFLFLIIFVILALDFL